MAGKRLNGFGYGTARDRHDPRDHVYKPRLKGTPPKAVDLRRHMPPVYNQHHLNSCSANAIAAAIWFEERHRHHNPRHPSPSRLFIYYNEREIEGVVKHDESVSLRDGYKTVVRHGVCLERTWPYDVLRFRRRPPDHCYTHAEQHRAVRYARLEQTLEAAKACLAGGQPFTAGFAVYESFKSALVKHTGVVPLPSRAHETHLGGHAMLVVGYLDDSRHFIVRNSWGPEWGHEGYCYIPYQYALDPDLAWDFWTVQKVT
jgi:C1A family cysteine protease